MADASRRSTRFSMRSKQLGQLLVENGDVGADQIAQALKIQEKHGGLLGQILRQNGYCDEQALVTALLKQVQVTDVRCEELSVPSEVAGQISRELCEAEKLCPFELVGNLLCVVMGNPLNRKAISQIEQDTGLKVKSFKAVWPKIQELVARTYDGAAASAPGDDLTLSSDLSLDPSPAASHGHTLELDEPAAPAPIDEPLDLDPVPQHTLKPGPKAPLKQPAPPRKQEAPSQPRIKGIDDLNEANAVVIDTDARGLANRQRGFAPPPPPPPLLVKAKKEAKVNVDLDKLDLSQGEVVAGAAEEVPEGHEEISYATPAEGAAAGPNGFTALQQVQDGYFYADGTAPAGGRSPELRNLVAQLPVAQRVAASVSEYESEQRKRKGSRLTQAVQVPSAALAGRPLELQPAPTETVTAVLISDAEFQRLISGSQEDPLGEWDWAYAAQGPLTVVNYDEN